MSPEKCRIGGLADLRSCHAAIDKVLLRRGVAHQDQRDAIKHLANTPDRLLLPERPDRLGEKDHRLAQRVGKLESAQAWRERVKVVEESAGGRKHQVRFAVQL